MAVHYGADDFKDRDQLTRTLGRERAKDTTLDYSEPRVAEAFAERRGLVRSEILVERGPVPRGRPRAQAEHVRRPETRSRRRTRRRDYRGG